MPIDLPTLKIVSISDLFLHEEPDPVRSQQLAGKLLQQGILRNPPMVMVLPTNGYGERYMVLDGANRVTAFQNLGYPHIIVQVIPNEESAISLLTWNHLVWGLPVDQFLSDIKHTSQNQLEPVTKNHIQIPLNDPTTIHIRFADLNSYSIRMDRDMATRFEQIHRVTSCYKGKVQFDRTDVDDIGKFQGLFNSLTALIVFPLFKLSSILEFSEKGFCLPSGITHFIIQKRALHLNYPLDELTNFQPTSVKQDHLDHWIQERIRNRNIRQYPESTVLFDD